MKLSTLAAAVAAVTVPSLAFGQVLFSDDFETAQTGIYNVVTNSPAGSSFNPNFAFTGLGATGDVRTGTGALVDTDDALTAFVDASVLSLTGAVPVSIKYDIYLQPVSGGSTELGTIGVGSGANPFVHYLRGSLIGTEVTDGVFVSTSTDSDTSGAGDYTLSESAVGVNGATYLFNGDAADQTQGGTGFGSILPAVGVETIEAVAAFQWVEVEMIIDGSTVTYNMNGVEVATAEATVPTTGLVGIGIFDPFPGANNGAVGSFAGTSAVIDNLVVTAIPEPASLGLLSVAGLGLLRRRKA